MERTRLAARVAPRRFICLNAIHNARESMVLEEIAAASTPFASRMRHGFVKPRADSYADTTRTPGDTPAAAPPLLEAMRLGDSGSRVRGDALCRLGQTGQARHPCPLRPPRRRAARSAPVAAGRVVPVRYLRPRAQP